MQLTTEATGKAKQAFTPGPWQWTFSPVRKTLCVMGGDTWICGELQNPNWPIGDEALGNARLIAAAPELLAALTLTLEDLTDGGRSEPPAYVPAIEAARHAIAKATGAS